MRKSGLDPSITMRQFHRVLLSLCVLAFRPLLPTVQADEAANPVIKTQFIYETAPFSSCHASTIAETHEGFAVAWFGGTREKDPDVGIWLSRYVSGAWTDPIEVANGIESPDRRHPCWNPVLFQPQTGPLMLFYKIGPDPETWWGMLMVSYDAGRSWSEPRRLPDGIVGPIKNKPVQLANGDILSPSSSEHAKWRVHFERSADLGKTWTATQAVNDGVAIEAIQPSVLILKSGHLQAIGRTRQGKLFEIFSTNQGLTWGELKLMALPNPNSGTDAVTLADGRHLVIYNHTAKGRWPLNVAVSDDGRNWCAALVLEHEPGEFSYPAVIQSQDGLVHFVYTWNRIRLRRVVVDPKKLVLTPILGGNWP